VATEQKTLIDVGHFSLLIAQQLRYSLCGMLGAIRSWAVKELGGVKRAPVVSTILLLGGLGLGWWIAGHFDELPFTKSTYSNLTNAELRQRTKVAVTALRMFNERYLSQRNSANLAEFDREFQTHLPEIRSLASELERRVKLPPNTDPMMDLSLKSARAIIGAGALAGVQPVDTVANYLDQLANSLITP
jgi:hypothetical protein